MLASTHFKCISQIFASHLFIVSTYIPQYFTCQHLKIIPKCNEMSLMNHCDTYFELLKNKRMMIVESVEFMIDLFRNNFFKTM